MALIIDPSNSSSEILLPLTAAPSTGQDEPGPTPLTSPESTLPFFEVRACKNALLCTSMLTQLQLSSTTSEPILTTSLASSTSPSPSIATASLTSSVGTIHTPATVAPSSSPDPPSSGSAGLSGVAKVGIGLGIPFGILLCAAIIYFSTRYHRRRTLRGIRAVDLHTANTEEKNTMGQNRDDGVIRELY